MGGRALCSTAGALSRSPTRLDHRAERAYAEADYDEETALDN